MAITSPGWTRARLLASVFAAVSILGFAVAVWLAVADGNAAGGNAARGKAATAPAAKHVAPDDAGAVHFTISASGDLLMHQPLLDRARANGSGGGYDFEPFFNKIAPYVAKVDLGLCHVETPMGPGPPTTYPIFNTPRELAKSIHRSGWDACSTASNHSLDGGQAGIEGTVDALDDAGVKNTGSFPSRRRSNEPTFLRVDGVKLGFVAYTDATNGFRPPHSWSLNTYAASDPKAGAKAIVADARKARDKGADAVIVQIHWGDENSQRPNASQLAVAKKLTDSKVVTVVVGQGPHVVQPIERVNGKFVVFSEGNLVSNQAASTGLPAATQDGIIALLRFRAVGDDVEVRRVTYVPTWVRLGDYVVLPAKASSDPSNAGALRDSYRRTVRVVGKGEGFGPGF